MIDCTTPTIREGYEFPCGKCELCKKRKAREWAFRLIVEKKHSDSSHFVTLTYRDEDLPREDYPKKDFQDFMKRLRWEQETWEKQSMKEDKYGKIKYWACFETSPGKNRPHWHVCMYNVRNKIAYNIADTWGKGFAKVGQLTEGGIFYTLSYLIIPEHEGRPRQLCSKGLGADWEDNQHTQDRKQKVTRIRGERFKVPRYYTKEWPAELREKINLGNAIVKQCQDTARYNIAETHYDDPYQGIKEEIKAKAEKLRIAKLRQKLHL